MGNKIEAEAEIKTFMSSHGQTEKMLNNGATVSSTPTPSSSIPGTVPFGATIVKYEPKLEAKTEPPPVLSLSPNASDVSPRKVTSRMHI